MSNLIKFPGVNVNVEVDKDDVLAIAVSNYEQGLLRTQKELEKEYRDLSKDKKDKEKSLGRKTKSFLTVSRGTDLAAACTALTAAGMGNFSYSVDLTEVDLDAGTAKFQSAISANSGDNWSRTTIRANGELDLPEALVSLAKEITEISDRIRENAEKRLEIRRDLDNIATKERQAKAHIAIQSLSQTEEGKAFLASITQGSALFLTDGSSDNQD